MKITKTGAIASGETIITLTIGEAEFVKAKPTKAEYKALERAGETGKISDHLRYLTLLAKSIEEIKTK